MAWSNSEQAANLEEGMREAYQEGTNLHGISMILGRIGLTVLPHDDARQLIDAMHFAAGAANKTKQKQVEDKFEATMEQIQEYLS